MFEIESEEKSWIKHRLPGQSIENESGDKKFSVMGRGQQSLKKNLRKLDTNVTLLDTSV